MRVHTEDGWIVVGDVRVTFVDLGEGAGGEYDATDPNDTALLRLDCNVRAGLGYDGEDAGDGWVYPDQGSICTQVPVDSPGELEAALLQYAGAVLDHGVRHGRVSVKRMMDWLSWLPDIVAVEAHRAGVYDAPVVQP